MVNLFENMIAPYANDTKLVKGDHPKLGLKFRIVVRCEQHGYENDGNTYHEEYIGHSLRYVHVIIAYPHRVFIAVVNHHNEPTLEEYKNVSNHDSCYRSAINLAYVGFDVHAEAYSNTPKEHIPPPGLSVDMKFDDMFKLLYSFVEIETEYMKDGYHQTITKITPKQHEINILN